jgi:membrane-bound lytic murein transglycosylase A
MAAAGDPADLPGWDSDDHAAALRAYGASAHLLPPFWPIPNDRDAAAFFTKRFAATAPVSALVTGYYEPELPARLIPDGRFRVPLHAVPAGLAADRPWATRTEIEEGSLLEGRELAWVEHAIDAFLAQVQGSVRLRLEGGQILRLGYAGRNGQPYRSIGAELIRRGEIAESAMSADAIRAWCLAHPDEEKALLRHNPSYVFFRRLDLPEDSGPLGSSGVPLVPGRSIAADPKHIRPGAPVWLDPGAGLPPRLVIAQDTGSAVLGPDRADLFLGSGVDAGRIAGAMRHRGTLTALIPAGDVT